MTKTGLFKKLSLEEWQRLYTRIEFLDVLLEDPFNSELAEAVAQRNLNAVAE